LTPEELELIAGGYGTTGASTSSIVVVASPTTTTWYPTFTWTTTIGSGGGGGGGDGGGNPENDYPDANDTPCVETSFAGSTVSTDRVNNAALAASNAIAAQNDENQEYGAFVYELNGEVYYTPPFTSGSDDHVDFSTAVLPDGAHVLGIIHNHPDQSGIDDRTPSPDDWNDLYNGLAGHSAGRGITIDANMLMYIYSDQDHKTHVYDNTDKNQSGASCSLQ